jgi:hypothetical protein
MTTETKPHPCLLRVIERGYANDMADYPPPMMHVGRDGQRMTTLTLHREAMGAHDHAHVQISITGGDGHHNLERALLEALDAVRHGRVQR